MQNPSAIPAPPNPPSPLGAAPLTREDVQALRVKLRDLRSELQDAAERRNSVASRLPGVDDGARPGMLARLNELDTRILTLEREITATGAQLRGAPTTALVSGSEQPINPREIARDVAGEVVPIVAIVTIFFLAPIAFAIARLIWKRATVPPRPAIVDQVAQQRLEQLQQSVDTIAIEVERISEGQRFVTKLLSDRDRAAIGGSVDRR